MAMDSKCGLTDQSMTENGRTTRQMVRGDLYMLMEMSMKDSGRMIKLMALVITDTLMEQLTRESGKMISNMARVLKHGQMELGTKVLTLKGRSMEREHCSLPMVVFILVTSNTMKYQEKANTCGQTKRHMRDSGKRIKCMAMVY